MDWAKWFSHNNYYLSRSLPIARGFRSFGILIILFHYFHLWWFPLSVTRWRHWSFSYATIIIDPLLLLFSISSDTLDTQQVARVTKTRAKLYPQCIAQAKWPPVDYRSNNAKMITFWKRKIGLGEGQYLLCRRKAVLCVERISNDFSVTRRVIWIKSLASDSLKSFIFFTEIAIKTKLQWNGFKMRERGGDSLINVKKKQRWDETMNYCHKYSKK